MWAAYRAADAALGKTGETCLIDGIVVSVRGQIAFHMGVEPNTLANNLAVVRAWTPALLDTLSGSQVARVAGVADQAKRETLVSELLARGVQVKLWQSAAKLVNDGIDPDAAAEKALYVQQNPDAAPATEPAAPATTPATKPAAPATTPATTPAAPATTPAADASDTKPNTPSKSAESAQASDPMLAHLLAVREMLSKASGKAVGPALQHLDAAIGIRMDELAAVRK